METRSVKGSPAGAARRDANARLKAQARAWFWGGLSAAALVHFVVLAFGPPLTTVLTVRARPAEFRALALEPPPQPPEALPPPRVAPPPPAPVVVFPEAAEAPVPRPPARPAEPVPVNLPAGPAFEPLASRGLAAPVLPAPPLPPLPSPPETGAERGEAVPFTVKPELVNREQIRRILLRRYPSHLRRAGIEGTVVFQFWIDEQGEVTRYEMARSSGNAELDRIAEDVIELMEFRPALNMGKPVPVSVALPIVFEVR
ncbi:MAG TPA: energy transducer TonB [Longimicrobiales bacterium]